MKEHQNTSKKGEWSERNEINWEGAAIVDHASRRRELSIKEALQIQLTPVFQKSCWPGTALTKKPHTPPPHRRFFLQRTGLLVCFFCLFVIFSLAIAMPTLHPLWPLLSLSPEDGQSIAD